MDQQIDEKITWQSLLLTLGITAFSVINYREYNTLKKIYKSVNSEKSIPTKSDSVIIEKIRSEVIEKIRNSNIFNKFNKSFILDSISKVDFRIVDSIDFIREEVKGCYINLKRMKDLKKNIFLDVPSKDNYIILQRSSLYKEYISETISHEIYHYFDKLLGNEDKYSEEIKLNKYTDPNVGDKKYAISKIENIIGTPKKREDDKEYYVILNELYRLLISEKNYYTKNSEIFARYKTLKDDMVKMGVIKNINSKVSIDEIMLLLKKYNSSQRLDILSYLFYLDLSKIEDLDKVI